MSINIHIEEFLGRLWVKKENVFFTGSFFYDGALLTVDEVYDHLNNIKTFDDIEIFLSRLNGFFSFIVNTDSSVFAVVDHVRSVPLFYTTKDNHLCISNDAEYIRKLTKNTAMDALSIFEFVNARIVTGSDTLFSDVKQVQTGEMLAFTISQGPIKIASKKHFIFTHDEKLFKDKNYSFFYEKMLSVFSNSVDKMIEYANGRQLVLPLSAGYDSRFIALMLKQKNYSDVICFSYGEEGNFEARISQQVAEILGFRWEFVEYTEKLWHQWVSSKEHNQYRLIASGWASIPCLQDWPAVWMLKLNNKISKDAVFIPGHVGDSLAGSDVPVFALPGTKSSINKFLYALFIKYYSNLQDIPKEILPIKIKSKWQVMKKRVLTNTRIKSIHTAEECANEYEKWNWQESNPKFIVNSIRVYEFWGYDWYLPFVDKEFMLYWMSVPLSFRYGKSFYNKAVDEFYKLITNKEALHDEEDNIQSNSVKHRILEKIRFTCLHRFLLHIRKNSVRNIRNTSTNCILGRFDDDFLQRFDGFNGSSNFLNAVDFIITFKNFRG